MEYNGYPNIHELCEGLPYEVKNLHEYSDYIVNGKHCALTSSTMNTRSCSSVWMLARTKGDMFHLSSQYFLSLTYEGIQ